MQWPARPILRSVLSTALAALALAAAGAAAQAPAPSASPASGRPDAGAPATLAPPPARLLNIPRQWQPLARDGLHDPRSPAVQLKQQPAEALAPLAPDTAGNLVRWVEALDKGQINPRATLNPGGQVRLREDDILLNLDGGTPIVRFPHRQHTLWLDCSNCHNELFIDKKGANRLSMERILQGEQCGVCHGAVSFPLTECNRCHSVPREKAAATSTRRLP